MNDGQRKTGQDTLSSPKGGLQKPLLLLLALLVLLALAAYGYSRLTRDRQPGLPGTVTGEQGQEQQEQQERIAMIDVVLTDMEGQAVQLLDLTGKPMVLHFWATWCGICDEEMPDWESLYQEFGDQVTFVMVDVVDGVDETVEKGKAYLEENGYTFPAYFDTQGEAAYVYGVTGLPATLFVDSEGYYVAGQLGMLSPEGMRLGLSMAAQANGLELEGLETETQEGVQVQEEAK